MDEVLTMRAHGSRRSPLSGAVLLGLGVLASVALAAPAAQAAPATLWACHGPDGRALGDGGLLAAVAGDGATNPYGSGCGGPAPGGIASGGLRATFTRVDPAGGSSASWRVAVPAGLTLQTVALGRRTHGLGGGAVDGAPQRYRAFGADTLLESDALDDLAGTALDGTFSAAVPSSAADVRAAVDCALPAGERCAAAPDLVAVDLGSVALGVDDAAAPRASVAGLRSPAAGTLALTVDATDAGLGLAGASASIDGVPVASSDLGAPASCGDMTPGDGIVDLPLADGCPGAAIAASLPVDTTRLADGLHQLRVVVRDVAGNATTAMDQTITVRNTPLAPLPTTVTLDIGSGAGAGSASADGGSGAAGGVSGASGGANGGSTAACAKPKLSMLLSQKPLRIARGRPVLATGVRYRFNGRLTCLHGTRRVSAPRGTKIELLNIVKGRFVGKSGTTVRTGGAITILLAYKSSRTIEFRYRSTDGSASRVRIAVTVSTKKAKPKAHA
jgi:hypothetical protein